MATDWFSNSVRENQIKPGLDSLDSGELSLDQWNIQYGDVPLYHTEESGYRGNYRENMDQLADWMSDNRGAIEVNTDFDIKPEFIDEFNTKFPKGKVVQIPSNAKGGNLTNDQVISYTNLSRDAGITQTKFYMAVLYGRVLDKELVTTSADGKRDWKPGVTREQKLQYNWMRDAKDAFKVLFNTQRSLIDRAQEPQNASQETSLWNSKMTEVAGEGAKNITQDEMLGDVQMSELWDTYPAVKSSATESVLEQDAVVESDAETDNSDTDGNYVTETGESTNIEKKEDSNKTVDVQVTIEKVTGNSDTGATANLQTNTDVAQNLRNIDYFTKSSGQARPNILHAFSSYNTNFDFFMMTPYDYNEVSQMLISPEYDITTFTSFENKPRRRLFGSSGVQTSNTSTNSSNNQYFQRSYHIENVELSSYVSPSKVNGGSKFTTGRMTVFEPYGATLLENIVKASVDDPINSPNYMEVPYLLKVSFKGYDDQGNPIDTTFLRPKGSESASTSWSQDPGTKYITVKLSNFTFKITPEGSEYDIEFYNFDAEALESYYGNLQHNIQINGGNLGAFFDLQEPMPAFLSSNYPDSLSVGDSFTEEKTRFVSGGANPENDTFEDYITEEKYKVTTFKKSGTAKSLAQILNRWEQKKVSNGDQDYADRFAFAFDDGGFPNEGFKTAQLAKPEKMTVSNIPVQTDKIKATLNNRNTTNFSQAPSEAGVLAYQFPKGASIISVIHTAIATSTFITNQVRVSDPIDVTEDVTRQELSGVDPGLRSAMIGTTNLRGKELSDFAARKTTRTYRNDYSLGGTKEGFLILYKITPRIKLGPYDYKRKTYQKTIVYVISLYNREGEAATQVSKVPVDNVVKVYDYLYTGKNKDVLNFDLNFNSTFFSRKIIGDYSSQMTNLTDRDGEKRVITPSGAGDSDNITGSKSKSKVVASENSLAGGDTSDPSTLIAKDLMTRIYESGADLLSAELEIMGDPMFIVQDESFGGLASESHFAPNGSVSTHKDPIVQINILTPTDIGPDGTISPTSPATRKVGPGGAYTEQYTGLNKGVSSFSGRYRVLTIENKFDGNTFTQVLQLAKITDEDVSHVVNTNADATNKILYSSYYQEEKKATPYYSDGGAY